MATKIMATIDTSLFPSATFKVDSGEAMPVTSRLNALRESQLGDIKFRQAQQEEADNMLLRQAYNAPDPVNFLAQQGRGDLVPAVKQSMYATQEAESKLKTQNLAYDKAHHERIDQLIGDVTRYTTADQANSALDSMLEKGEIDPQTHSMYRNIVVSTPWPQAKTQILGGLRTIQEQFESMQPQAPMSPVGKAQADLAAAIARGDTEAAARLRDYISKETTHAPGTNITVKTGEEAATAFSKELGQKVAGELDTLNTKAQSAKSSIETSQLLRPLLQNKDFISGTLGDTRLAVAKALGLSGADETQAFFAGIGKQVAENIKAFGSGTAVSDTDLKFAQSIVGGSKDLTPSAIKQIMELNDKYAQMAIDKYNSRKKFLSQKNPTINDYYEDIVAPSVKTTGGAYNDADKEARYQAWKAQQSKK